MQELEVKKRLPGGGEEIIKVKVHRIWHDAGGLQIFLHSTGVYGYKDGSPVRSKKELETAIPKGAHLDRALNWWSSEGAGISRDFYERLAAEEMDRVADFRAPSSIAGTELDAALYTRRSSSRNGAAVSAAKHWEAFGFESRPDWWGQAATIQFNDFIYERKDIQPVSDSTKAE